MMFVVVRLDVYDDSDCGCFNKGTVDDVYGPFADRKAAEEFCKECEALDFYATNFEIRGLEGTTVPPRY